MWSHELYRTRAAMTTTSVVDLGCFPHGAEVSIEPLIDRFKPKELFGFDPWPKLPEGHSVIGDTDVYLSRDAAWVSNCYRKYACVGGERSWDSTLIKEKNSREEWLKGWLRLVRCFDLCEWLKRMNFEHVIVKFDVEGAEFALLEAMWKQEVDMLVDLVLVEWHDDKMKPQRKFSSLRSELLAKLRCPVEEWSG